LCETYSIKHLSLISSVNFFLHPLIEDIC